MQEFVIGKDLNSTAELIGKGGEGEVYAIKGRSGQAVKIYNLSLRAKREEKVRAMVGERLAITTEIVAFPGDIVTDRSGNFLGFVMRLVSGYRPLHELYSPKSRRHHFPTADYRFIVRAALNLARAVWQVHQTSCVIGDLNHSGVLIAQDATVVIIDADSFQLTLNSKFYPCVVGVPDFTPPELHGKNLAFFPRTVEHDNFGLAVAIFQLLFMGRHPYAGLYNGPDLTIGDAIAQNRFAFSTTRQTETLSTPPPGSLTLNMFPDLTSIAFEKAFGLSSRARPTALDWIHILSSLEITLNQCSNVKTHYYPRNAGECVWCKLLSTSGFDMFPDLSIVEPKIPTRVKSTEQVIREILAFPFPTAATLLPAAAKPGGISNSLRKVRYEKRRNIFIGLIIMSCAILGFNYAKPMWFIWIGLVIWGLITFTDREVESLPFLQAFNNADELVQLELNNFIQRNGLTEVVKLRGELDVAIAAYKDHDKVLSRELQKFKTNREARQRQAYLDRFSIRDASISGIGPSKTAMLLSYGIETAADVKQNAILKVPGFGAVMTGKVMAWRRGHESKFKYDPNHNSQDVADERALRNRFAKEKSNLESTISSGLTKLNNARIRLGRLTTDARNDRPLNDAIAARAQAEQDLIELGIGIPASTVTLTVTHPPTRSPNSTSAPLISTLTTQASGMPRTPSCPRCGSQMRMRSGSYGHFWGCSLYPSCKGTQKL